MSLITSSSPAPPPSPLTRSDVQDINVLFQSLREICRNAKQKGITVIIDAEYSWYQPAIDAITLELTREFNRPSPSSPSTTSSFAKSLIGFIPFFSSNSSSASSSSSTKERGTSGNRREQGKDEMGKREETPTIYGTYQSYLRRALPHLALSLSDARKEGYMVGVKLVRGAYQGMEVDEWRSRAGNNSNGGEGTVPPVWTVKADTDETYNACVRVLVQGLKERLGDKERSPLLGVIFGTHNPGVSPFLLLSHGGNERFLAREGLKEALRSQ